MKIKYYIVVLSIIVMPFVYWRYSNGEVNVKKISYELQDFIISNSLDESIISHNKNKIVLTSESKNISYLLPKSYTFELEGSSKYLDIGYGKIIGHIYYKNSNGYDASISVSKVFYKNKKYLSINIIRSSGNIGIFEAVVAEPNNVNLNIENLLNYYKFKITTKKGDTKYEVTDTIKQYLP